MSARQISVSVSMPQQKGETELQNRILDVREDNPDAPYKDIADELGCSVSYVSEVLGKAEDNELDEIDEQEEGTEFDVDATFDLDVSEDGRGVRLEQSEWFRVVAGLLDVSEGEDVFRDLAQDIATQSLGMYAHPEANGNDTDEESSA